MITCSSESRFRCYAVYKLYQRYMFRFIYLLLFYLFLPSMGWLCGVGVLGLIECPHSLPALHSGLQNNNNNNNNIELVKEDEIVPPCDRHGDEIATLRKHVT